MATSSLGFYTRFTESLADDEDPVDTGYCYYGINNINHLADQRAEHRVNWIIKSGAQGLQLDPDDVLDTTNKFFLYKSGTFDLHLKTSGESYSAGIWLYCHSGSASYQASFYATLAPAGDIAPERALVEADTGGVNVVTASCTRTTHAWEKTSALAYLNADMVRRATQECTTVDTIGGSTYTVQKLAVRLWVFTSAVSASAAPELGGVRLVEYLPP